MTDNTIFPAANICIDNIQVDSYFPDMLQTNGTSLIMALLMICYRNNPYTFEYMVIRKSNFDISQEPLHYGKKDNLVLKEICVDIQKQFSGVFGSIYVQMTDNQNHQSVGISFWNEKVHDRSISIAYHTEKENAGRLHAFINQVYTTFLIQQEKLIQKLELPDEQIA